MTAKGGLAACLAWVACALCGAALANPPVESLADGRAGRIHFRVPAGDSTLSRLVTGTYVESDTIWGDLILPEGATGAVPVMVISHGSGGLGPLSYEWADVFAAMGVASFVMDHFSGRGFGATHTDQSLINSSVIPADGLVALRLLATHPRIDASRIGHIGFSKGGSGALVSGFERLRAALVPGGTRFALHVPFYPGGRTTADFTTGAPIRVFMGDLDDYDSVESTRAMVESLRAGGADAELTVYPGAYHAFDASFAPVWVADAQTSRACPTQTNIDTLVTIDPFTGARIADPLSYIAACRTLGVRLGRSEPAREQARQAVWSFVRERFGLAGIPGTLTLGAQAGNLNRTALWWNPAESGWGINLNHQGDILFGTLFTYAADRAPLWLVMPAGNRQGVSSTFAGDLYRVTGPAFNAVPFTPITDANLARVGKATVTFTGTDAATLVYDVNAVTVSKAVRRQVFGSRAADCQPEDGVRIGATNYQDLWWNPAESGWGLNVTHQDDTLFATLFTYDAAGRDLWLVMSAGYRQADGSYLGDLLRTTGPPFDSSPFQPIGASDITTVGTMRMRFGDGENGTLGYSYGGATVSKAITRQVFSTPRPLCR